MPDFKDISFKPQDYVAPLPQENTGVTSDAVKSAPKQVLKNSTEEATEILNDDVQALKIKMEAFINFWKEQPVEDGNLMHRIIKILIELTKSIQDVAITQANQLGILTQISKSYIQLQQNIPTIVRNPKPKGADGKEVVRGPGGEFDEDTDKAAEARADANRMFASQLESIRTSKGIPDDLAKKQQAALNTTKEAANAYSDFISSSLDLLRNIGSMLFR